MQPPEYYGPLSPLREQTTEDVMNRLMISTPTMATAALLCSGIAFSGTVLAQTGKEHVGTWALVSTDTVHPDGRRVPTFGGKAGGVLIFGSDGRFIYLFSREELPKFASNNRTTGTPEENAAVVKGSIATYGTYSVADKTFTIKIEHSTFPNWIGAQQTRTITVTGDDMKWSNPAGSGGGVVELVLKRVK
jgi:Lipocalin-like domain